MAQGGLHRGVAVCGSVAGHPMTQPSPGLVPLPSVPNPHHLVFCTGTSWGGDHVILSNARRAWYSGETVPGRRKGPAPTATVLTAPG